VAGLALCLVAPPAAGRVLVSLPEALKAAFPGKSIERKTAFLTPGEVQQVQARARARLESAIVTYYVATASDTVAGYAYPDSHLVRTMPEVVLVVLDAGGAVERVEILAFHEPEDYLPRTRWLSQFQGRFDPEGLWVRRQIRNATLTAQAVTEAVRRVLALHVVIGARKGERR